jgi:5-dehydro-2-deoxygluconokinase
MHKSLVNPVYMLAIDHRWQWNEWCDKHGVDRARIPEIKRLAADAFLRAREASEDVRRSGALLVDLIYGREAFDHVRRAGAPAGNPAERAGSFPLEWTDSFNTALPGDFVKVLVRHRADLPAETVQMQLTKLLDLQQWCVAAGKPLVLEVLVTATADDERFEREGRPQLLAEYIRRAYALDLVPQYWKIEGMPDAGAMRIVDDAISDKSGPRQLILGKGAGLDTIGTWFESAHGAKSAAGFAIGRTVYWDAATRFLLGTTPADEAMKQIVANYQTVIDLWRHAHIA